MDNVSTHQNIKVLDFGGGYRGNGGIEHKLKACTCQVSLYFAAGGLGYYMKTYTDNLKASDL